MHRFLRAVRGQLLRGVVFDGTNDYMALGASLGVDGKTGLLSFWFKSNADATVKDICCTDPTNRFEVSQLADNKIYIYADNAAGVEKLKINTSAIVAADGWTHIMASWNLATPVAHLYVNNVSDKVQTTLADDTIDYTTGQFYIGANEGEAVRLNADIAEFYFAQEFFDISVAGNGAKFISGGTPGKLGPDGSWATGTQPIVYQSLRVSDAATVFATNRGSLGNFSITGALALSATMPKL